jgi:ComF family protein
MTEFFKRLVYLLFPKRCPFCSKTISAEEDSCGECRQNLSFAECKMRIELQNNSGFQSCVSPFYYEGIVRKGIIAYKFRGRENSAGIFAKYAAKTVKDCYSSEKISFVSAVPLSKNEKQKRGYNQSEIFARKVAKELSLPYRETLLKIKNIKPQRTLGEKERKLNVTGAFSAKTAIKGTVLLVDDIITTGATLEACAGELKKAGAEKVLCVTIATTRMKA